MEGRGNGSIGRAGRCLRVLDAIPVVVSRAVACTAELADVAKRLDDLGHLVAELAHSEAEAAEPLEGLATALQDFLEIAQRCGKTGPLEALFQGHSRLYSIAHAAMAIQAALQGLHRVQLPIVAASQAKVLAATFGTVSVDFRTLRMLTETCNDLREQAERKRVGSERDGSELAALVARVTAGATPAQLAADATYLEISTFLDQEQANHIEAYCKACLKEVLSAQVVHATVEEPQEHSTQPPMAVAASAGVRPPGSVAAALAKLSVASGQEAERAAALEDLRGSLQQGGPEAAAAIVASGGVASLLRQLNSASVPLRVAALDVLSGLLEVHSQPEACGNEVVQLRGLQVLGHMLTSCAANTAAPPTGRGTVVVARQTAQPAGKRVAKGGGAAVPAPASSAAVVDSGLATALVTLLRRLTRTNLEDLVAAGTVRALSRAACTCSSWQLPAIAALAEAVQPSAAAAVQLLQERALPPLASMACSGSAPEASAALACLTATLQSAAGGCEQLAAELGAVDAATVTALLDIVVSVEGPDGASAQHALQVLPCLLGTAANRAAVMRHGAGVQALVAAAVASNAAAAAALRRLAQSDEEHRALISRLLSQALVRDPAYRLPAALLLAEVIHPASRDRSSPRSSPACHEVEQCGALPALLELATNSNNTCRAAGAACMHSLCLCGDLSTRAWLGSNAVMTLVDLLKLVDVPLPDSLRSPGAGAPGSVGQAAAEALAALAASSEALRKDICSSILLLVGSSSVPVAAAAAHALGVLVAEAPAAGPEVVAQGVLATLAAHVQNPRSAEPEAVEFLMRTVRLIGLLCRGGGTAVDTAVAAGITGALVRHLGSLAPLELRLLVAAVLASLLRAAPARAAVYEGGGLDALLALAREAPLESPRRDDALAAVAALVTLHAPCQADAAKRLRHMLVRGTTPQEVAAAALIAARMSASTGGRKALLAGDMAEPLVRILLSGDTNAAAKSAAATALAGLAVPATVELPPCAALPQGGSLNPKAALLRAGAVPALLALLRDGAAHPPSPSPTGAPLVTAILLPALEALEAVCAGSEEGVKAVRAAPGGLDVLKLIISKGKQKALPAEVAKSASAVLMMCM